MAATSNGLLSSIMGSLRIGSTTGLDRPVVPIDIGLLKEIEHIYSTNSMVSTAVSRYKMYVLRSGINIKVNSGKTFNFDKNTGEDKTLFDQELYPAIVTIIEHWIIYGFACVSVAPSQYVKGAYTLVVLPWNFITVSMQHNEYLQMTYKIELKNAANITPETKNLIDLAQFLCVTPPNDAGKSMSPIALCLEELRQYKKLWEDYVLVSHRLVHPIPIFNQTVDAYGILSAGTAGRQVTQTIVNSNAISAGLGSESTSRVHHKTEERRNQATRDALHEAKSRREEFSASSTTTTSSSDQKKYGDPLADIYIEPTGQRLDASLRFDSPNELRSMSIIIEQKFGQALGLPNDENVYSTAMSVDMYLRLLNMTIITFCKKAQYLLTRPIAMVFNGKIVASIVDDDTKTTLEEKDDNGNVKELDNDKLRDRLNEEISKVNVTVDFSTTPVTTLEQLTLAYQGDVIPYEQYVELVLAYTNIQKWKGEGVYYSKRQSNDLERQVEHQVETQERVRRQRVD